MRQAPAPLRATRGLLGITEELAVTPRTTEVYRKAFAAFSAWSVRAGLGPPTLSPSLDATTVD